MWVLGSASNWVIPGLEIAAGAIGGGGSAGPIFEAGDVTFTLATYAEPEWLTPMASYDSATYPDADDLFAGDDLAGFSPVSVGYGTNRLNDVAYLNGGFVVVTGHGKVGVSPDGITWTDRPTTAFGTDALNAVAYGNGLYVAAGLFDVMATSPDTITWTTRDSSFAGSSVRGIEWNGSIFVAVGDGGKIATSPDGITWTQRAHPLVSSLYKVKYAIGLFVVVAQGGQIATSPDGITWTARTSGFGTSNIGSLAFGGGVFVAGGSSGKIATSPDGITWTQQNSGITLGVLSLVYAGSFFVFGSTNAYVSLDGGVSWSLRDSGISTDNLVGLAYGNGAVVATSTVGTAVRSELAPASTFTVPEYTAPDGFNAYVYSGVTS